MIHEGVHGLLAGGARLRVASAAFGRAGGTMCDVFSIPTSACARPHVVSGGGPEGAAGYEVMAGSDLGQIIHDGAREGLTRDLWTAAQVQGGGGMSAGRGRGTGAVGYKHVIGLLYDAEHGIANHRTSHSPYLSCPHAPPHPCHYPNRPCRVHASQWQSPTRSSCPVCSACICPMRPPAWTPSRRSHGISSPRCQAWSPASWRTSRCPVGPPSAATPWCTGTARPWSTSRWAGAGGRQ